DGVHYRFRRALRRALCPARGAWVPNHAPRSRTGQRAPLRTHSRDLPSFNTPCRSVPIRVRIGAPPVARILMQFGRIRDAVAPVTGRHAGRFVPFGLAALLAASVACSGGLFPARQVPVGAVAGGTPLIPAQIPTIAVAADDGSLSAPERIEAGLIALSF